MTWDMVSSTFINILTLNNRLHSLLLAAEGGLGEEGAGGAGVKPRHPVHADDVQLRVLGHGEPGEREEPLGQGGELLIARAPV